MNDIYDNLMDLSIRNSTTCTTSTTSNEPCRGRFRYDMYDIRGSASFMSFMS